MLRMYAMKKGIQILNLYVFYINGPAILLVLMEQFVSRALVERKNLLK